jgi:hypothetical protein
MQITFAKSVQKAAGADYSRDFFLQITAAEDAEGFAADIHEQTRAGLRYVEPRVRTSVASAHGCARSVIARCRICVSAFTPDLR